MALDGQEVHRPGPNKQQNKSHKHGKHRSKGQVDREFKGRVSVKTITKRNHLAKRKADRRNQTVDIRKRKREEILEKKRARGGIHTPPHFVVVLSLTKNGDTSCVLELLKSCDESATVHHNEQGITHISIPRFKQRISFFTPEYGNLYALMDAMKIADSLLCVLSPQDGIDDFGSHCLSCLNSQGIPSVIFVCNGFKNIPAKKQAESRKNLQRQIETRFPKEKFHCIDSSQDALLVVRQITNQKHMNVNFREARPHLIAEEITFELDNADSECGTLKATGYLRGKTLNVNRLVHLPGWGDFQMLQIDAPHDPYPLQLGASRRHADGDMDTEAEVKVVSRCDPSKQESLESEVLPDPMEGEQTWPTEEELAEADMENKKIVKKVPKGTSSYQANWIIDSDQEDVESDEDSNEEMAEDNMDAVEYMSNDGVDAGYDGEAKTEYDTVTLADDDATKYDANMDLDEEQRMLVKIKEEKSHEQFPDEIDTPGDIDARKRFARFRGLQSFRTSPWDPKENLDADYARIFQFENFKRTRKRCIKEDLLDGAMPGSYVTIHIAKVPKSFMENYKPGTPVVAFGLLPHEQKISIVHMVIRKVSGCENPIRSKDQLVFHVGYRRFSAGAIFSQHTLGNKHKFERFLPSNTIVVATVYAPILFPPASVLVFHEESYGVHDLVATGSLMGVDPNRIIAKRVVLSGYPYKINKHSAVIRYMFFSRDDITWFKPVELRTKWGRRGHIKEPLGTHGHMKCVFDGMLKSQDTILMNLYKRMYPKWTYNPHVTSSSIKELGVEESEEDSSKGEAFKMFE